MQVSFTLTHPCKNIRKFGPPTTCFGAPLKPRMFRPLLACILCVSVFQYVCLNVSPQLCSCVFMWVYMINHICLILLIPLFLHMAYNTSFRLSKDVQIECTRRYGYAICFCWTSTSFHEWKCLSTVPNFYSFPMKVKSATALEL